MAPYLEYLTTSPISLLPPNPNLLSTLKEKNKDELAKLNDKLEDAEKNLGETEISDALREKALYLARIGEKDEAIAALQVALEKTAGLGSKIDLRLAMVRVGFFWADHEIISSNIEKAQVLVSLPLLVFLSFSISVY